MKIYCNGQIFDKFVKTPQEVIKQGYLSLGYNDGGGYHISLVISSLKYRQQHPTNANIKIIKNSLPFVSYTFKCQSDHGNSKLLFTIIPEIWDKEEDIENLIIECKKVIKDQELD